MSDSTELNSTVALLLEELQQQKAELNQMRNQLLSQQA